MVQDSGARLPHAWMAGDDEIGRPDWFRRQLDHLGAHSLLAVPGNTWLRDLETAPPEFRGRGRRPTRPRQRVAQWSTALAQDAWTTLLQGRESRPLFEQFQRREFATSRAVRAAFCLVVGYG